MGRLSKFNLGFVVTIKQKRNSIGHNCLLSVAKGIDGCHLGNDLKKKNAPVAFRLGTLSAPSSRPSLRSVQKPTPASGPSLGNCGSLPYCLKLSVPPTSSVSPGCVFCGGIHLLPFKPRQPDILDCFF